MDIYCFYFSDELPVQLTLPRAIREAKNRQQLSSLALLGQGNLLFYCAIHHSYCIRNIL